MRSLALSRVLALCAVASLCIALLTLKLLQYRFGGYDVSPLIDSGWRVYLGQVPNRDFICTFPPILYLAIALAFHIVGVSWRAITLTGAAFPLALIFAGLRLISLLRPGISEDRLRWLAIIYSTLQMTPLLALGFPWHSSWTQATSLYALLATFALCLDPGLAPTVRVPQPALSAVERIPHVRRRFAEPLLHLCIAEALLLLAKPNVALPVLIFCTLALLLSRPANAVIGLVGAVLLASLALTSAHTSLMTTFHVYAELTSRFHPGHYLTGILYNKDLAVGFQHWTIYVILLPVSAWVLLQILRPGSTLPLSLRALAIGGAAATWLGIGTNVEFKLVDAPTLLLSAALILIAAPARPHASSRSAISAATYALFALAVFFALSRARMQEIGVWAEGETCGAEATIHDPFFGTFTSCRNLLSVLNETDSAIQTLKPRTVFFGPRMEFLYAREHIASPRGLPLWWHPGSSYPFPSLTGIITAFDADRPEVLIFLHEDRSYLPAALLNRISRDYQQVPQPPASQYPDLAQDPTAQIDIYRRR